MSDSHYDLAIQHNASVEPVDRLVRDLLILLDKEGDPYIEYKLSESLLFPDSKTAILENITKDEAEYYQKRFREMMVETSLRPTMQLMSKDPEPEVNPTDLHTCPACKHQQPRSKSGMNTCQNCNLVAEKYQRHQRREDIIAQESRNYKNQQDKLMREALERARLDEEDKIRREAREILGLERKKRPLDIAIGVTAIVLMVVAGILIVTTMQREEHQTLELAKQKALDAKQIELALRPQAKIVVAGISDPSKRPVVETSPLLPGEQEPSTEPVTKKPAAKPIPKTDQALTQTEIDRLKQALQANAANPYFNKLTPEQFEVDHQKLARLLELNKPELAVAFVNSLSDNYAASLLLLDVVQSEVRQNHHTNDADILRTFNTLLSRAPAIQQTLVSANFSLMYRLQGDKANAQAALEPALEDLKSTDNGLLFVANNTIGGSAQAQKLGVMLQMVKDLHHYSQKEAANELLKIADDIIMDTPAEPLAQAEAMTLLASACVVLGDAKKAGEWLNKITDVKVRGELLEKLDSLQAS
ncbi:MAG TPA: hypothetical protein PLM98_06970 [Thiolinea sp.]|nr:hypothetical protein [Thiolinea sp.]